MIATDSAIIQLQNMCRSRQYFSFISHFSQLQFTSGNMLESEKREFQQFNVGPRRELNRPSPCSSGVTLSTTWKWLLNCPLFSSRRRPRRRSLPVSNSLPLYTGAHVINHPCIRQVIRSKGARVTCYTPTLLLS